MSMICDMQNTTWEAGYLQTTAALCWDKNPIILSTNGENTMKIISYPQQGKFNFVLFHESRKYANNQITQIQVGNDIMTTSDKTKYIGLTLDKNISYGLGLGWNWTTNVTFKNTRYLWSVNIKFRIKICNKRTNETFSDSDSDSDSDSRNLLSTKGEQQKNTVKEQFKT